MAYRSFELIRRAKNDAIIDRFMTFVMNDTGSSKMIRQRSWRNFICLVSMEGLDAHRPTVSRCVANELPRIPVVIREIEVNG